ncbi:Hypothetical protein PHPALM_15416 [Phytophthora palmivora]|uniref:Uncharacterized protein n=1 Tax=Phytophthora palmivora TaxID=4796 RepID=A0A2P4XS98_9STRA|nr:Hypothetical protein PHPALM_15416 [Phytophthora palmivora]
MSNGLTEQKIDDIESAKQVEFTWPVNGPKAWMRKKFTLKFYVDEANRRDTPRLQQLREAMELFTFLSLVNNETFKAMFPSATHKGLMYPTWNLWLCGTLSPDDPAAVRSSVTWGALLGFPDNLCGYSGEYLAAIQKLKTMGIEDNGRKYVCNEFNIKWTYGDPFRFFGYCFNAKGTLELDISSDNSEWFDVGLRRLFECYVDPMVQLCLTRGGAKLADIWQDSQAAHIPKSISCRCVAVEVPHLTHAVAIPQMTAALARTPASHLYLRFGERARSSIPTSNQQSLMEEGFLLSTLLCGRSICEGTGEYPPLTNRMNYSYLSISCERVSEVSVAAICSAVAEIAVANFIDFTVHSVGPGTWPWLTYAICCGTSAIPSLTIYGVTLMKSDITAIADVLKTCYPKPSSTRHSSEYGFVTLQEGTEVWPIALIEDNDSPLILSSECRCRARFNGGNCAEVVIPGYGVCKASLREGLAQVSCDSERVHYRENLMCRIRSLYLCLVKLESVSLVVDLLALICGNLRSLQLINNTGKYATLDLTALSAACPGLEQLRTTRFDITVSDHDEALQEWPLKRLSICETTKLAGIVACFRNPALRMTGELLDITLDPRLPERGEFDEEELKELVSHDEEFLPVVKEKFPIELKIACSLLSLIQSPGKLFIIWMRIY